MNLHSILTSSPIDSAARRVTSQAGCATDAALLSREELAALVQRLSRKQRLLKLVLGITNKRQHKNTVYKAGKGLKQFRAAKEPRALTEYRLCGREIARLNDELANLRRLRQMVANAENECKALMVQRAG